MAYYVPSTAAAWTRHGDKKSEAEGREDSKRRHQETVDGTKSHVVNMIGEGTWHPERHGKGAAERSEEKTMVVAW